MDLASSDAQSLSFQCHSSIGRKYKHPNTALTLKCIQLFKRNMVFSMTWSIDDDSERICSQCYCLVQEVLLLVSELWFIGVSSMLFYSKSMI